MPRQKADPEGPVDGLDGLDRLLAHQARLAACVLLSRNDALTFRRLKDLLQETDGSLGAHMRKLEDSGYVNVRKTHERRRPVTWYRLSERGKRALAGHLDGLDRLLRP